MLRLLRLILRTTLAISFLALLLLWFAYWLASRSLPDYNASYEMKGLNEPLEIVRDHANVPHILGETDRDSYFGLGFVHAQDRLYQMMLMRRTAQGKLSEVFGTQTLETDILLRSLGLNEAAEKSFEFQSAEAKAALEAYSNGINAWIDQINEDSLGRGAPEYFIFPSTISYWRPSDSIALVKLLALQLSDQINHEVLRARTSLVLPAERLSDILPDAPGTGTTKLISFSETLSQNALSLPTQTFAQRKPSFLSPVPEYGHAGASNIWSIGHNRSVSKATIMANDPHLKLSAPGALYLARLNLESGNIIGATVPGIPAIVSGRKNNFGWGITSSYLDDADLHLEKVNPANINEVLTPDGYKPVARRQTIIHIKDAPSTTLNIETIDQRPILPENAFNIREVTPLDHKISLSWSALSPEDTSISALIEINHANSISGGLEARKRHIAPAMNLLLSEPQQSVMTIAGAIPKRHIDHETQGRMPSPAWNAQNLWQGYFDTSNNPIFENAPDGALGNTNNKTADQPFPEHLSYHWGDTQRITRWTHLMNARQYHTRDSFIEMQNDIISPSARSLLPLIAGDLWFTSPSSPEGSFEHTRETALKLLADWNGAMNEHFPEPLIYATWLKSLQKRLIQDELGKFASTFKNVEPLFIERVFRDIEGASVWCDIIQSKQSESCQDIAKLALDDAIVELQNTYGANIETLRWGNAHTAQHRHPTLGEVPFLKWFVNIEQSTSGGDNTLMRGKSSGAPSAPFENVHASAYRGIYDFGDPESSLFIIPAGQSGHPLSRHYDDLGELWRRGEYVPMSFDIDLARAAGSGTTQLSPK